MKTQNRILITGGTESFGKMMLQDLLDKGCPEVRILGNGRNCHLAFCSLVLLSAHSLVLQIA